MEKNPWYKNVEGPFLQWKGPIGVKEDGGGCTRGQGRVGNMIIHRAAFNKNTEGTDIVEPKIRDRNSWYSWTILVNVVVDYWFSFACCSNSKGSRGW